MCRDVSCAVVADGTLARSKATVRRQNLKKKDSRYSFFINQARPVVVEVGIDDFAVAVRTSGGTICLADDRWSGSIWTGVKVTAISKSQAKDLCWWGRGGRRGTR